MDLFSPIRLGVRVTAGAVKLASFVPRTIIENVVGGQDAGGRGGDAEASFRPTARQMGTPLRNGGPAPAPEPSGPARGGTGRRPTSPRNARGRASSPDGSVEVNSAPPEPTSAAGASGGVAGTVDAPGDAAAASAPDPTAATSAESQPTAPQGERKPTDTRAEPISPQKTVDDSSTLRETEGSATPSAQIRIDAPWEGYDTMKANEIVARVKESDASTKAVVRLYESTHKKRKSILSATES